MTFHIISKFIMIVKTFLKNKERISEFFKKIKKKNGDVGIPSFIVTIDLKHVVIKN